MGFIDRIKGYFQPNTIIKQYETQVYTPFSSTYDAISTISRCVDLIVNTCAEVEMKIVEDKGAFDIPASHRNFQRLLDTPSIDLGKYDFFRSVYKELVFSGNCFLYNLGTEIQILEEVNYESGRVRSGNTQLDRERLIHTKLLRDINTLYGTSYLSRIDKELDLIVSMLNFQNKLFSNGAIPGVILESENPLSQKQKDRIAEEFMNMYAISKGNNSKPFIADNSIKFQSIEHSFKELEFSDGIKNIKQSIISGLGVPEVLISGGNNANISPNYKNFVYTTIASFVENVASELTLHLHKFYPNTQKLKIVADMSKLRFLQDDVEKINSSIKTLVLSGILTINEAREKLGLAPSSDEIADTLHLPANITGNHLSSGTNEE